MPEHEKSVARAKSGDLTSKRQRRFIFTEPTFSSSLRPKPSSLVPLNFVHPLRPFEDRYFKSFRYVFSIPQTQPFQPIKFSNPLISLHPSHSQTPIFEILEILSRWLVPAINLLLLILLNLTRRNLGTSSPKSLIRSKLQNRRNQNLRQNRRNLRSRQPCLKRVKSKRRQCNQNFRQRG